MYHIGGSLMNPFFPPLFYSHQSIISFCDVSANRPVLVVA